MSQQLPNDTAAKPVIDVFAELSKDDKDENLDLTKPLKDETKPKEEDEIEVTAKDDDDDEDKPKDEEVEITLEDLEEELEPVDDTKLELTTPVRRKEILAKYPNLFKDFPYLEKAYYREQQFTEILPTIDEAKEAAESHKVLQRYTEDMVENGNIGNVLKMIKDSNPETFNRVVDDYMTHLQKIDNSAFIHVQSNLVKNIIISMVEDARNEKNDDLRAAALFLNKWAFGSSKFIPPRRLTNPSPNTGKEDTISKREQEFNERQVNIVIDEINVKVNNSIKSAIDNNIDPSKSMTDYIKKNASKDAMSKISSLIEKDTRFQKIVTKLWEKAAQDGYSAASQGEIRKAFLSKAKSLLAPVLKSARNEALKGMGGKAASGDNGEDTETPQREKIQRQSEPRLSSEKQKAKLDSLRGKSSFEALNALMGD